MLLCVRLDLTKRDGAMDEVEEDNKCGGKEEERTLPPQTLSCSSLHLRMLLTLICSSLGGAALICTIEIAVQSLLADEGGKEGPT